MDIFRRHRAAVKTEEENAVWKMEQMGVKATVMRKVMYAQNVKFHGVPCAAAAAVYT